MMPTMNQSEFGHPLRRICLRKHGRGAANPASGPRTARHDLPPHPSVELLWRGPGPGTDDDGA
ncbi:hypothetical protein A5682_17855 [Mycobacterium mantenii]|uniref:Uncharacterized protein n=2 Tax=Mycobacterium mantenii TaxID=560555 RepID=A0A1A2TT74_MYCNT|nr:hypothetical protein A5688_11955 [Mycobacterium mantenii]OBH49030.1 hypothetical protein A5687_01355 [Mycobacterium mantenii]OBH78968.1 hypothetical protein A5683_16450 [Mycobacterium mantenii]OBH79536.1 hypothetical protein A5682_17855 [Mycobacterium mantenii]